LAGIVLVGLVAPFACSSGAPEDDDDDDDGCSRDIDCALDEICENGECVRGDPGVGGSGGSAATGGSSGSSGSSATGGASGSGTGGSGAFFGWTVDETHDASYDIQGLWGATSNEVWAAAGGGTLLGGAGQLHGWDGTIWDLYYTMATPGFTDIYGVTGGANVYITGHGGQFYELTRTTIEDLGDGSTEYVAVWASAPDAVWVAANSVNPFRFWDGTRFLSDSRYSSPSNAAGTAIWGSSATDVWGADTDGSIHHFDGNAWTQQHQVAGADFYAMHGSGPSDVWAVGPRHVLHYDGNAWSELDDGIGQAINDVWAAGPNDAWFVGEAGRIFRGGPSGLTPVESGITEALFTIWGTSPTDIWAGGEGGMLIHYGPVDTPTQPPDGGTMECSPQGYGCMDTPCCPPFRCANIGNDLFACI
jgi:hypothetical protein